MLDLQFIRDNLDIVKMAMKNKKREGIDLDRILDLAEKRKKIASEIGELNRKRNEAAAARDIETGKKLKEEAQETEHRHAEVEKELVSLLIQLPNIPSVDTPVGSDESGNNVIRQWGDPSISLGEGKPYDFTPKTHSDLGKELGVIDSEKAADVSGARFTYLKGDLALMQFAIIDLAMKTLSSKETLQKIATEAGLSVTPKPFIPVIPPVFIKKQVQIRMARFFTPEEHYLFPEDDVMLIGSAEHTLGPLHMDETIPEARLPIRYVGYSTAFRREAGSYGKDTKGILRQHQFDKIEMESLTRPEDGMVEQDFLIAIQEYLLRQLKLPYRVVLVCTGDMGFPDQRQIDIETWMPGQDTYRETHSADYVGGFQARRLNTKVKRSAGESEPVHMNDATVFAIGRTLIAIMENYQQEDGTILIPDALRSSMCKDRITKLEV